MKAVCCIALLLLALPARAEVAIPDGYRMDHYRAATPDHLPGARTVTAPEARDLAGHGAVLVDVTPIGRAAMGARQWILPAPHESLPGAVWLPNAGYGRLDPAMDGWFRDQLARLTDGDKARPLIFFCMADCWMSWNAGRRAMTEYGYRAVHWFPEGTDGWRFEMWPMAEAIPVPPPP